MTWPAKEGILISLVFHTMENELTRDVVLKGRLFEMSLRREKVVYCLIYIPLGAAAFGGAKRSLLVLAEGMSNHGVPNIRRVAKAPRSESL